MATKGSPPGSKAGLATATVSLATVPGSYEIKVTYPGGFGYASSWAAAPIDIQPAATVLRPVQAAPVVGPADPDPLVAIPPVPNHKMGPIAVSVNASDAVAATTSRIVEIRSSESQNGLGDGDQSPDWQITGTLTANLRAERAQNGLERTYTLVVETRDAVGNLRYDTAAVFVPK